MESFNGPDILKTVLANHDTRRELLTFITTNLLPSIAQDGAQILNEGGFKEYMPQPNAFIIESINFYVKAWVDEKNFHLGYSVTLRPAYFANPPAPGFVALLYGDTQTLIYDEPFANLRKFSLGIDENSIANFLALNLNADMPKLDDETADPLDTSLGAPNFDDILKHLNDGT